MKLEDQVCSLELSKRLKELGVKQESLFVWISIIKTEFNFIKLRESFEPDSEGIGAYNYAAYTAAELGELLPKGITVDDINYFYTQIPCRDAKWWSIFYRNEFVSLKFNKIDPIEADARAKMLIYLLENKLMELPNDK